MKFSRALLGGLAAFACCAGISVTASTGPNVDISERVRGAQRVVVATATTVTAGWQRNEYGDELIVSELTLAVEETLKGTPQSAVLLHIPGGTLDGVTLQVSSMPTLKPGERGVFFLNATANGAYVPHLQGQGILKLNSANQVTGSSLRLEDIRRMAQTAGR